MLIKKQLLYATLFASSCLFSTTIVKADEDTSSQQQAITTQASTQINTTDNVSESNKNSVWIQIPEGSNEEAVQDNTVNQNGDNTSVTTSDNSNDVQSPATTQDNQSTQAVQEAQSTYHDEAVNGVFTIGNSVVNLHDNNDRPITNRYLGPNTAWRADYRRTYKDKVYYRVATTEYVDSTMGTYRDYAQPYDGVATVVYKSGASVHDFQGFGDKAVYLGNNLPTGSSWKVNSRAQIGGKDWYQVGSNTWVPQDYVVLSQGQYQDAKWISGVPLIAQRPELPNGCEITAVTMMLQYAEAKVNKMQMAREMPRSSDPNYGYIGQPWDGTGITIFPPALMSLVEKYAGTAKNLTGQNFNAIKYQINIGHPIVTWNTLYGFPYHALVVTGYDKNYVYYNDCWTNQTLQMGINQFINNWNTQKRRAISY